MAGYFFCVAGTYPHAAPGQDHSSPPEDLHALLVRVRSTASEDRHYQTGPLRAGIGAARDEGSLKHMDARPKNGKITALSHSVVFSVLGDREGFLSFSI